jgi:transcriptional regulator with XRE-family HTH domain
MLEQLGEAIRRRREGLGLSQEAVSMDAQIDRSYLSQVEERAGILRIWGLHAG